jgi:formamidopyrimidine-DNA glycosylase
MAILPELFDVTVHVEALAARTKRLRAEAAGKFPEKVTAFREGMLVHGRYGEPCPRFGARV